MLAPIPAGDCANVPHQIISMDAFRGDYLIACQIVDSRLHFGQNPY